MKKNTDTNEISVYTKDEALIQLVKGSIQSHVWNKLYKSKLFNNIKFDIGKYYEDIYIMHKLFGECNKIAYVDTSLYYYLQRSDSIVGNKSLKSLLNKLEAYELRREALLYLFPDNEYVLLRNIIISILDVLCGTVLNSADNFNIYRSKLIKYGSQIPDIRKLLKRQEYYLYRLAAKHPILFRINVRAFSLYRAASLKNNILTRKIRKVKSWLRKLYYKTKKANKRVSSLSLKRLSDRPAVFLMGSPEYGNLGDHAIAYATKYFVNEAFKEFEYFDINEYNILNNMRYIKKHIKNKDVLLLQGGGNLGNMYMNQQVIRRKVIKAFPGNKIILIPQTVYFENTRRGKAELKKTRGLFASSSINLIAREQYSFKMMKDLFKTNNVLLAPDIVMSLPVKSNEERKGVLLCMRNDLEGKYDVDALNQIKYACSKIYNHIVITDTRINKPVTVEQREHKLKILLQSFSRAELVVTDRLHGAIFAVITSTPCVVLGNFNHKIQSFCKWFEPLDYVCYCDKHDNLENCIKQVTSCKNAHFDEGFYKEKFQPLKSLLDAYLKGSK